MSSTDDDVKEATAALKGMLGIGDGGGQQFVSTPDKVSNDANNNAGGSAGKKKKKNKKKTPQQAAVYPQSQPQSYQEQGQGGFKKKEKNIGRGPSPPKNANKGKKQRDSSRNKQRRGSGGAGRSNGGGKFAWSAFQSSPDASSLPLPSESFLAFSASDITDAASEAAATADEKENKGLPSGPDPSALPNPIQLDKAGAEVASTQGAEKEANFANVKRAEDLEAEAIAAAEAKAKAKAATSETADTDNAQPTNATGINLAELASKSATSSPASVQPKEHPSDPIMTLIRSSRQGQPTAVDQSPRQHPQPQHSPRSNQLLPQFMQQQQHQSYLNPATMQQPQQQPHIQQQCVTIQVQIPPTLLPGRQMMVQSPSGYPVAVTVPEGVAAGMVVPVTIPAGPVLHHPPLNQQQHPQSMHMMQAAQHQQMMMAQHGAYQQQNQAPYPRHYSASSPQKQEQHGNRPMPGTWAARAAASGGV